MRKWKWMAGMKATDGARVLAPGEARSGPPGHIIAYISSGFLSDMSTEQPDWTDPATRGCLLEQVRWRHASECSTEYRTGKGWRVVYPVGEEATVVITEWHGTEAEALLAAMEEAE